jgi:hypothetical protein
VRAWLLAVSLLPVPLLPVSLLPVPLLPGLLTEAQLPQAALLALAIALLPVPGRAGPGLLAMPRRLPVPRLVLPRLLSVARVLSVALLSVAGILTVTLLPVPLRLAIALVLAVAALLAVTRLLAAARRGLERRLRAVPLLAVSLLALPVAGVAGPELLAMPRRLPVPGLVLPLLALAWLLVVRLAGRMRLRHSTVVRREERTGRAVAGRLVTHSCEATLAA